MCFKREIQEVGDSIRREVQADDDNDNVTEGNTEDDTNVERQEANDAIDEPFYIKAWKKLKRYFVSYTN